MLKGIFLHDDEVDRINKFLEIIDVEVGSQIININNEEKIKEEIKMISNAVHNIRLIIGES